MESVRIDKWLVAVRVFKTRALAAECFVDHSPPPEPRRREFEPVAFEREAGAGRPTKRDRRQMDRLRRER